MNNTSSDVWTGLSLRPGPARTLGLKGRRRHFSREITKVVQRYIPFGENVSVELHWLGGMLSGHIPAKSPPTIICTLKYGPFEPVIFSPLISVVSEIFHLPVETQNLSETRDNPPCTPPRTA